MSPFKESREILREAERYDILVDCELKATDIELFQEIDDSVGCRVKDGATIRKDRTVMLTTVTRRRHHKMFVIVPSVGPNKYLVRRVTRINWLEVFKPDGKPRPGVKIYSELNNLGELIKEILGIKSH